MSTVNRAKHIGVRNMTSYDTRKRKYIPMGQFKGDFEEMDWLFDADHNFEGQVIRVTAKAILLNHQSDSSSMRKDS